jgi:hypothetical protein
MKTISTIVIAAIVFFVVTDKPPRLAQEKTDLIITENVNGEQYYTIIQGQLAYDYCTENEVKEYFETGKIK